MGAIISKAPSAPDPYATAAAQTAANKDTAAYNTQLNRVDTYTPYGNSVYTSTGTTADPHYRQDINLTPDAQAQVDNELKQNKNLSELGFSLADQYKSNLAQPLSDQAATGKGASDAYYAKQTAYLDPDFQNQQNDLNVNLSNKGVMEGSAAYDRAQSAQARNRTFAYDQARNQSIATGQDQKAKALALALQIRQNPLNEMNAVRTGSQVQNPTFSPTYTGGNAQAGDVQGGVWNAYNAQAQNANSLTSGLFGLGSAALLASDRRLKTDVKRIGETPLMSIPLYLYRYIGSKIRHVGVMAQDVPWAAVRQSDGYLLVNYGALA